MAWLEALGSGVLLAWLALALLAWAVRARPEHAPAAVHRRSLAALVIASACLGLPALKAITLPASVGLAPLQVSVRVLASSVDEGRLDPVHGLVLSPFAVLATVWLAVCAFAAVRSVAIMFRLHGLLGRAVQAPAAEHATLDEELASFEGRAPRLLLSDEAASPFSVGTWRPMIVLPTAVVDALDDAGLRFVLRHELLHFRRRDPLTHALARLCALPFTAHPSLPGLLRQLSLSRELAVDREAAQGDPRGYARVLLQLAELARFGTATPHVAMDDTALSRRIALLTSGFGETTAPPLVAPLAALAVVATAVLVAPRVVPELAPIAVPFAPPFALAGGPFVARAELPFGIAVPASDPMAAYQSEISACYELARREDDELRIDTLARFVLEPQTFSVIDVDLAAPGSPTFERCLTERAKHWRFPPPVDAPPLPGALAADAEAMVAVHIERHP